MVAPSHVLQEDGHERPTGDFDTRAPCLDTAAAQLLADIAGLPMIVQVWHRAMEVVWPRGVAAAETEIVDAVISAGGERFDRPRFAVGLRPHPPGA